MIGLALDVHHHDLYLAPDLLHFAFNHYRRLLFSIVIVFCLNELYKMGTRRSTGPMFFGLPLNMIIFGMTVGKIVYDTQPKGNQTYDFVEHLESFLKYSYHQVGLNLNMDVYRSPGGYVFLTGALVLAVYYIFKFISKHRTFRICLIALAAVLYVAEFPVSASMSEGYSGKMFDLQGQSARFKVSFIPRILLFTILSYRLFLFLFGGVKYFINLALRIALFAICVGFCVSFYRDYVDKNFLNATGGSFEQFLK